MASIKTTERDIRAMKSTELVAWYNTHSRLPPITRFSDRTAGVARCLGVLEAMNDAGAARPKRSSGRPATEFLVTLTRCSAKTRLSSSSQRAQIVEWLSAQPDNRAKMSALDAHFRAPQRQHIDKLASVGWVSKTPWVDTL